MTSKPIRVIVVGGTGYTGAELVRLVLGHPSLELVSIVGNTTAGQVVADVLPNLRGIVDCIAPRGERRGGERVAAMWAEGVRSLRGLSLRRLVGV
jgi:N-acetyl-gamma-glutamylphosphate reductase